MLKITTNEYMVECEDIEIKNNNNGDPTIVYALQDSKIKAIIPWNTVLNVVKYGI